MARTPEASAVKKRKSLFMNVVQSTRDDFGVSNEGDQGGVTYDKILPERDEVVLTPVPISKRERNEISSSFGNCRAWIGFWRSHNALAMEMQRLLPG